MTTNLETFILDSAGASPLTLQSGGTSSLDAFDPGVAQRRPTWASGAESDGSLLVTDPPYNDAEGSFRVRFFPTAAKDMPTALGYLDTLVKKLQECSASGPQGMACTWTPANHTTTYTLYLKLAEVEGLPIEMSGDQSGWFAGFPVVTVRFTRDPYLWGPEIGTVTDNFSANSIANYTADVGATSNVSITGGVMQAAANLTTQNVLARTAGWDYTSWYDRQATVKVNVGGTLSGFVGGVVKAVDASNRINIRIFDNGTASTLEIVTFVAGVGNIRASQAITRLIVSTSYWVRGRIEGNVVYAELWTSAPTATGTPAATTSYALTGTEITALGLGVAGKAGVTFTPQHASASLDDFTVEPNVWVTR